MENDTGSKPQLHRDFVVNVTGMMTREEVVQELIARMDADIMAGADYCVGETAIKALLERYRKNEPY